jgi:hypothetical protein
MMIVQTSPSLALLVYGDGRNAARMQLEIGSGDGRQTM